jgi:hypothetical protein
MKVMAVNDLLPGTVKIMDHRPRMPSALPAVGCPELTAGEGRVFLDVGYIVPQLFYIDTIDAGHVLFHTGLLLAA